jgi:hypothetical protein
MTLMEALKSGRPYRRKGTVKWLKGNEIPPSCDIFAEDYEVEGQREHQFDELWPSKERDDLEGGK